ncbi:hypothetical protein [Streptomyces sp. NPDC051993]|uniref:hypothetical protein n=1 Tax=Streptomyces sp. NPDC051993 TaxID=3155286 RepID=UPI00341BFC05
MVEDLAVVLLTQGVGVAGHSQFGAQGGDEGAGLGEAFCGRPADAAARAGYHGIAGGVDQHPEHATPENSIPSIAKLLGVSPCTLYSHIPDGQQLRATGRLPENSSRRADRFRHWPFRPPEAGENGEVRLEH